MEAAELGLLEFFKQTIQIMIPDPTRDYRWTEEECQKLWDDIIRVAGDDSADNHFIGTIIYVEHGILRRTPVPRLILLDGQQRLVTIALLMAALAKADEDAGKTDAGHSEINDLFLFNSQEKGEFRCKLLPAQGDAETFFSLINGEEPPSDANKLLKNYYYFKNKIIQDGIDTALLYKGIAKLTLMDVSVDRPYQNPKSVSEKLDFTGLDERQKKLIYRWLGLIHSAP